MSEAGDSQPDEDEFPAAPNQNDLQVLLRYGMDADTLNVLLPQDGDAGATDDRGHSLAFMKADAPPEPLVFCQTLRMHLDKGLFDWSPYPDCYRYNRETGCMLLRPLTIRGWNNEQAYDSVLDFLNAFHHRHSSDGAFDHDRRVEMYMLLNEGVGGPLGKVRFGHVPCRLNELTLQF